MFIVVTLFHDGSGDRLFAEDTDVLGPYDTEEKASAVAVLQNVDDDWGYPSTSTQVVDLRDTENNGKPVVEDYLTLVGYLRNEDESVEDGLSKEKIAALDLLYPEWRDLLTDDN
jgi:hypothetical protein